jgi:4-hydroxy-4-methyl-2-oxoglutarate aldolase
MDPLAAVPVSTLCDVDKSLPVVDPAIRPLTYSRKLFGPAYTVVAAGEFLSALYAIGEAAPGDVLVIQGGGGAPLAALGELLATEAFRRGLGGIVVDGYVRDRTGLPPDLPLWARGTVPMAGRSDVVPRVGGAVDCGGVRVTPGDLVLADDDGIVIAPRPQLDACLERAGEIERVEAAVLRGIQGGASLIDMTNLADHVARLRSGEASSLAISPPD